MATQTLDAAPHGSAPLIRLFGWGVLLLMIAYLVNNALTFWFEWPGAGPALGVAVSGGGAPSSALTYLQVLLYPLALAGAVYLAFFGARPPLREEAKKISDANAYLIRGCFWAVVLVGVVDSVISFMRIEDLLDPVFGEALGGQLGRSSFRGLYVHTPLIVTAFLIALRSRTLGFHWLALMVVLAEILIVIGRFVFSYEQAFMADLVRFWYSALFLFASAYTLVEDGHVRVDVFYAAFSDRKKGYVNAVGSVLLGIILCWTILLLGTWSKASIINSPILAFEVTQSSFGAYVKYLMAGFLGVFAVTMMIEFVAYLFDSVADIREEPGKRETHPEIYG